ncbi:cysteine ABC transporter substrate-binding protein [Testudinibacter sp. P80/BLE/0925]|uniref:cysteine ABC transporter substrate-binding protein n=1 Tax=Testudinibacter sp. TW-1 TaxID=3417757 RepID=UPI003D36160D
MKKTIKYASALLGSLVLALGLTACGDKAESNSAQSTSSLEQIKKNDVIRIGVFGDKPPFGYVDSNGKNQGFDIEIAKDLAKNLLGDENKIDFVLVEAANRVEYLQSNKVDIILANFTQTPARAEVVDFAKPYMKVALGIVSKDGEVISDVAQLDGKTLLVNKGTTADTYFSKNYPNLNLLKFEQNTETFEALRDGRGAALAHDNTLLFAWAKENPGYTVGVRSLGDLDYIAPAVKKGDSELLNWLNSEIETLGKNGKLLEAYNKTLLPVYGDSVQVDDVVVSY